MRGILHKVQSDDLNKSAVDSEERTLPVGPSGKTEVRIVKPVGAKGTLPGLVYFHGAGWVMGDQTTHDLLVRRLATEAGAFVIFVDHDRSRAQAAALPPTAITAWEALFDRLDVRRPVPGTAPTILIADGASGVGSIAIQLVRALTDLQVITTWANKTPCSEKSRGWWTRVSYAPRRPGHTRRSTPPICGRRTHSSRVARLAAR